MEHTVPNGHAETVALAPDRFPYNESEVRLLESSKNLENTRQSLDAGHPKDAEEIHLKIIDDSNLIKDTRRRSSTLWIPEKSPADEGADIKVYKRRWIMISILVLFGIVAGIQWCMYSIIANVIVKYYGVSNLAVEMTVLVFLFVYLIFFLPAGFMFNTLGLRRSLLIGCLLNAVGCLIRNFSVPQDKFWVTMVGQFLVSFSQTFMAMIPVKLAATWFPANQVSMACAIGFNGMSVGSAIGYVLPPFLVHNSDDMNAIGEDLNRMYISFTVLAVISLVLTILFFQDKPPLPPSQAQKIILMNRHSAGDKITDETREFMASVKRLLTSRAFLILLFTFSLNVGMFCAFATLLNQALIPHYPGQEKEIGIIGLILVVSGIFSSTVSGFILDRTHAFKETTMFLYVVALIGWIAFTVFVESKSITLMFFISALLGFALSGVPTVAIEFAVEITFPEPESTSSGLICAIVQISGIAFTFLYGVMLEHYNDTVANWSLAVPLAGACICIAFIKPKLKRQAAQLQKTSENLKKIVLPNAE